jgi:hypothetical protein
LKKLIAADMGQPCSGRAAHNSRHFPKLNLISRLKVIRSIVPILLAHRAKASRQLFPPQFAAGRALHTTNLVAVVIPDARSARDRESRGATNILVIALDSRSGLRPAENDARILPAGHDTKLCEFGCFPLAPRTQ